MQSYIIEIEKALDWNSGYLDSCGKVSMDIKDAQKFDTKEDAQEAAVSFNIKFGRNGRIYARVR